MVYINRDEEPFSDVVYNGMFNKILKGLPTPDHYFSPSSTSELSNAVKEAAANGTKIAVRSGGCSWIGASCRSHGLLVDMKNFNSVSIDPCRRIARVGPAIRGAELVAALAAQGMAFPVGHCGRPGVGGYLLGGGLGLNWGSWGPACYSVRSIEVVTATGDILQSSMHENPDWLWMARGVGPGFPGIITEYELELKPRPKATTISQYIFSLEDAVSVAKWLGEVSPRLPKNVEVAFVTFGSERPFFLPKDGAPLNIVAVTAMVFVDDADEAREVLSAFTEPPVKPLARNECASVPFEGLHDIFDASFPDEHHYMADTFWSDLSTSEVMEEISHLIPQAPSGKTIVMAIMPGNGAASSGMNLENGHAAYSMDFRTLVLPYAIWDDPFSGEANKQWMCSLSGSLQKVSKGHFINEADILLNPSRAASSFSPQRFARLLELKAFHDPTDLFFSYPGHDVADNVTAI